MPWPARGPRGPRYTREKLSAMGSAIVSARREARLTREQLGGLLGLAGRAVLRWERGDNAPSRRHRKELVKAIEMVDRAAAAKLAVAFGLAPDPATGAGQAPNADPTAFDLAVFAMAEELEVAPRLVRGSLLKLLRRMREISPSNTWAEQHLEQQLTPAPVEPHAR